MRFVMTQFLIAKAKNTCTAWPSSIETGRAYRRAQYKLVNGSEMGNWWKTSKWPVAKTAQFAGQQRLGGGTL